MSDPNNELCSFCKTKLPLVFPAFNKNSGLRFCNQTCYEKLTSQLKALLVKENTN